MFHRKWTEKEDKFILENWEFITAKDIAKKLHAMTGTRRSPSAVTQRMIRLRRIYEVTS